MNFYDCSICHAVNHVGRLHCQVCGAIPACYSMTGKVAFTETDCNPFSSDWKCIPIVPAFGCERQGSNPTQHLRFATVELDYYAGA